jgi:hypothetical protein
MLVAGILGLLSAASFAQQMKVFLEDSSNDAVGGRLAFAIKERIRSSNGFSLASTKADAFFGIHLVTLENKSNNMTTYSIVFTAWQPETGTWTYLNNIVGTCGSNRITDCADGLVADADKAAEEPKAYYRAYIKTQGKK